MQPLQHKAVGFKSLGFLYVQLLLKSFLRPTTIYVNEGGRVRYINLLLRCNPKIKVINHVRLLADVGRVDGTNKKMHHIAVSNFIYNKLGEDRKKYLIYDPVDIRPQKKTSVPLSERQYGVIGRVTPTKGLDKALQWFNFLEEQKHPCQIHFFGAVENDKAGVQKFIDSCIQLNKVRVVFHGFESNKAKMYSQLDAVFHFNSEESFGLVLPESWLHGVPLITFKKGGLGELAQLCGVEDFTVEENEHWLEAMYKVLFRIEKFDSVPPNLIEIQKTIQNHFSPASYVRNIEKILLS